MCMNAMRSEGYEMFHTQSPILLFLVPTSLPLPLCTLIGLFHRCAWGEVRGLALFSQLRLVAKVNDQGGNVVANFARVWWRGGRLLHELLVVGTTDRVANEVRGWVHVHLEINISKREKYTFSYSCMDYLQKFIYFILFIYLFIYSFFFCFV